MPKPNHVPITEILQTGIGPTVHCRLCNVDCVPFITHSFPKNVYQATKGKQTPTDINLCDFRVHFWVPSSGGTGEGPRPPLCLDQTEDRRAEKEKLPHPLSQGLDDRALPYLKVWIGHCPGNSALTGYN